MSNVSADTANWRLFGGGGIALGALLWLIAAIVGPSSELILWLNLLALLLIAAGFFFVAWGQTGSNGAVGNLLWGKLALWAVALGFLLYAVFVLLFLIQVAYVTELATIGWVLITLGAIAAAVAISTKGVAKGVAKFALFGPAILFLLYTIGALFGVAALGESWVTIVTAVLLLLTGVVYVLNGRFAR